MKYMGITDKKMKKIVIYSIHGTSNIDYRIVSQALFLKHKGYDVSVVEMSHKVIGHNTIYKDANIKCYGFKSKTTQNINNIKFQSASFDDNINNIKFKSASFYDKIKLLIKLIKSTSIYKRIKSFKLDRIITFFIRYNSIYKRIIASYILNKIKPDIIISRDISSFIPKGFHVINDLHEIYYFQLNKINDNAKRIQYKCLSSAVGIICVTPQIAKGFYSKFFEDGKGIIIPNAPYSKILPKTQPNFDVPQKLRFLIHGFFIPFRDGVTLQVIDVFSKINVNAILYLRFLDSPHVESLKDKYSQAIIDGKIEFLPPIKDGIYHEVESIIDCFDIGIISVPDYGQYNICSPNRLGTYMHSGLAILYSKTEFIDQIISSANSGVMFQTKDNDIEEKIKYLCNNPEKVLEMKKNAYKFAKETFNYENYGKELIKMIERV